MAKELSTLAKMGLDLYKGSTGEFSKEETLESFRQAMIDLNGGKTTFDFKSLRKNKTEMFEVMEEILAITLQEGLTNQFDEFVDVRNIAFGDKNIFMVDDYHLFQVATISAGNGNLRKQRLDRSPFSVSTNWKGIKIYNELELFLAGRVEWGRMLDKVNRSYLSQISADIYQAIVQAYGSLATPYKYSGSFDRTELNKLVQHIQTITGGREVTVYGTKLALQQATPAYVSYNMMDERNQTGFFRVIDGIRFVEIKQAHVNGTDNFAVGDDFLLVVPNGDEKIIKLVVEGEPIIEDSTQNGMNADRTFDFTFSEKYGLGVVTASRYGAYILT